MQGGSNRNLEKSPQQHGCDTQQATNGGIHEKVRSDLHIGNCAGGRQAIGARPAPSYAQGYAGYTYPPPPQNIYATPWVGSNTPWVFYQGDWFLRGVLFYFSGLNMAGRRITLIRPPAVIRPVTWYEPRWHHWYQGHPQYWQTFQRQYPYWHGHQAGQRYDQNFYNRSHHGQGAGWNQGFHGVRPAEAPGHGVRPPGAPGPRRACAWGP